MKHWKIHLQFIIPFIIGIYITACTDLKGYYTECTESEGCILIQTANDLKRFTDQCQKLAKCMDMDFKVEAVNGQSTSNPYACSLSKTEDGYTRNKYLYPTAEFAFKKASFNSFNNEIQVCEMMTKTGNSSKKHYDELNKIFKALEKEKAGN